MTNAPVVRSALSKRRSSRMLLKAAVQLTGQDRRKFSFTLPARATNLNRCGAAVHVNRELAVGSTVVLRNQYGLEVAARVVTQISAMEGTCTYGVEFLEPDSDKKPFWGISFPSA
jgi:PilZ domain-containing protein